MPTRNFHVPLSEELYTMLQAEAARRGRPGTQLVRDILEQQLRCMQADWIDREIEDYARLAGQGEHDFPASDGAGQLWELLKDDSW